jgi:hypothetical protein
LLTSVQWTLASTFDPKGWFFSKLDLAVTILFWTVHFLFDKDVDIGRSGKKGMDIYLRLSDFVGRQKMVCGILH